MGVINVTPDSFSDGGKAFNEEGLQSQVSRLIQKCSILDFGAESTAPMNKAIGDRAERERLEFLMDSIKSNSLLRDFKGTISLDSYRPENVFWFFDTLRSLDFEESRFLWNDVSGKFDPFVDEFFHNFPSSQYVFCHNEASSREDASKHMERVYDGSEAELIEYLKEFFAKGRRSRVLIDPCFGFSKSYQQNLNLLKNWSELVNSFPDQGFVFGISKKSFLRRWWGDHMAFGEELTRVSLMKKSEYLHLMWLKDAIIQGQQKGLQRLVLRVHDPDLGLLAKQRIATY